MVEHACSVPSLMQGETLGNVSRDMDTLSYRVPIGVTAGVCAFNFPAMIPLWMFPLAIACGNSIIVKPSEQDPGASIMLAQLAKEAGNLVFFFFIFSRKSYPREYYDNNFSHIILSRLVV